MNQQIHLVFDGVRLRVLDANGSQQRSWRAHSGNGWVLDPAMQTSASAGPIMEGSYSVDPSTVEHRSPQKEARSMPYASWGPVRIRIVPSFLQKIWLRMAGRRGGFEIHGGTKRGTAGCIELNRPQARARNKFDWSDNAQLLDFYGWLDSWARQNPGQSIPLYVDYSGYPPVQ